MLQKLKPLITNWRNYVVVLCGALCAVLLLCESDSTCGLIISKVAGVVLYFVTSELFIYLKEKGKLNELSDLLDR